MLIYTVSYQFVSRSIESWFDVKVEGALDAGLNLGRGTIDSIVTDLGTKTRLAAERLGESRGAAEPLALERLREQLSAQEVGIVGSAGQTPDHHRQHPLRADARARCRRRCCARRRRQRVVSQAEGLDEDAAAAGATRRGCARWR